MDGGLVALFRRWRPSRSVRQSDDALQLMSSRPEPARLRGLAPLAFVLVVATVLCGALGYLLARQSDDRQDLERRQALIAAVREFHATAGADAEFDQRAIRMLERVTGLKGLRWDAGHGGRAREMQPIVENGRIIGWFSWDRDARVTAAVGRLWPLLMLGLLCLAGFVGLSLWHVRRSGRALNVTRAQVRALATDSQTGLPNTSAMRSVLERALATRQPHRTVSYLLVDIDRFEEIVLSLGHQAADEVLTIVTGRLKAALPSHATLGALGGGRFAAVLTGDRVGTGALAARAVLSAMSEPVHVRGEKVELAGCVGFASAPEHGTTSNDIFRRADLALDAARQGPRGGVSAFDGVMETAYYERQALKRDLKRAVAALAFSVEYQPIVTANGYGVVGVEALLRWNHPGRGPISPAIFIPLAEQSGLMDDLGDFVLRRALADAKRWPGLYVAVNLSPLQLRDRPRVERITSALRDSGIDCQRVVLEITEGVLIEEPQHIKANLEILRALGCRIALDDFGSGYSSLAYLRQFPIDKLKIDRGFVVPLGQSEDAGVIIQAVVALGRALGLSVLVEGVETEEQRVLLRLAGCDEMQGYLFAKPTTADEITRIVAEAGALSRERPASLSA
jgi:diguanylate cyclase (GGDEF)-like protein